MKRAGEIAEFWKFPLLAGSVVGVLYGVMLNRFETLPAFLVGWFS